MARAMTLFCGQGDGQTDGQTGRKHNTPATSTSLQGV